MRPLGCVTLLSALLALAGCQQEGPPPNAAAVKPIPKTEIVDPLKGVNPKPGDGTAQAPVVPPGQQQQPIVPGTGPGRTEKPKSLIGNIRARAIRTERQNELRQIAQFHAAMIPPPKTIDAFKNDFKLQAKPIYDAISEGYYGINIKARQGSQDILAYETDGDAANMHYFARADGSVDAMPTDQLKAALGLK